MKKYAIAAALLLPMVASANLDILYNALLKLHGLSTASFPAAAASNRGGLLWDSTLSKTFISSGTAWNEVDDGPVTLTSVPGGLLAVADIGGGSLPARAFTVSAMRYRISVAGAAGTTNATVRVTDGSNNCDASFACNTVAGNYRVATSGTCAFAASASLTYTVTSIGDCGPAPTLLGAVDIEGNWR